MRIATGSYSLLASLAGVSSFVEASNDYLGPRAPGNVNIQNGGAYLDWLLTQPFADTAGMEALDKYFAAITDTLADTVGIRNCSGFTGPIPPMPTRRSPPMPPVFAGIGKCGIILSTTITSSAFSLQGG